MILVQKRTTICMNRGGRDAKKGKIQGWLF